MTGGNIIISNQSDATFAVGAGVIGGSLSIPINEDYTQVTLGNRQGGFGFSVGPH